MTIFFYIAHRASSTSPLRRAPSGLTRFVSCSYGGPEHNTPNIHAHGKDSHWKKSIGRIGRGFGSLMEEINLQLRGGTKCALVAFPATCYDCRMETKIALYI